MEFLPEVECDSQKFLGPPFLPFPLEVSSSVEKASLGLTTPSPPTSRKSWRHNRKAL